MITIKDVEHVAKLARLELTEEEKIKYSKQLGDILKYVNELNESKYRRCRTNVLSVTFRKCNERR